MISLLVVILFFIGLLFGYLFRNNKKNRRIIDFGVNWAIYLLLFFLGISVGSKKEILESFSKIGIEAFVIALGTILGSVIMAFILYKWMFKKNE
jgi:uncharacterized membrane protein YbjE (DUF340 family)